MTATQQKGKGADDPVRQMQEAHEHLVRIEKLAAIGQLAGMVAHDLRNPLSAIVSAAYYLRKRLANTELVKANPRIDQFLLVVEEEVQHCSKVITDLMDFAKVSQPTLVPVRVDEIIERSLSRVKVNRHVHNVLDFEPGLPDLWIDGEQMARVFTNLALNAHESMPFGGELTVRVRSEGQWAEITFTDAGSGIAAEDLEKIFEPLFTTKARGTGLGLAACREIVSRHGGSLAVSSNPGEGTSFTVRIPINGHSVNKEDGYERGQYRRDGGRRPGRHPRNSGGNHGG